MRSLVAAAILVVLAGPAHADDEPDGPTLIEVLQRGAERDGTGELFFAPGSTRLDDGQRRRLQRRAPFIAAAPKGWRVRVAGHADAVGPADENARLARARVDGIVALLRQAGVAPEKIEVVVVGEPPRGDHDAEGRRFDRRVAVRLSRAPIDIAVVRGAAADGKS